ncbi:hypothetical protein AGLY_018208 [Aphis glycines]|uniref:Reverse transcriptase domain-containing protein n=1 Tax=Aphis glycines TaxID=307491 RepID=A0A6G0SSN6_APHGL|nr:hypothetical protein AGLY_018208 [Aphis glycines]
MGSVRNAFTIRTLRRKFLLRKAEVRRACFRAKRDAWREFVTEVGNNDPWSSVYRWAKSGGKRPSTELPASIRKLDESFTSSLRETDENPLEQLVLEDSERNESAEQMAVRRETGVSVGSFAPVRPGLTPSGHPVKLCDTDEVKAALWRIESNKAAGLDGITLRILKQAWPVLAEPITHAFNCALRFRVIPSTWKDAALVVIRKGPGKDPMEAKSYRPISLLPALAKMLEGIIVARIRTDTDSRMSARQYGFTKNRSTVDAIDRVLGWTVERTEKYVLGIFLEITGAFDCLWWPRFIKKMQSNGCSDGLIDLTKSYLDGRQAHISRCPQGSQFGPDLWKQAMNPLLSDELTVGTEIVAYADDLAILVAGKYRRELTERANKMLERARQWANERKLSFSTAKTQTLWLKGSLTPQKPLDLRIGELKVKMTPTAKYLGDTFDQKRTFMNHLAEKRATQWGYTVGYYL